MLGGEKLSKTGIKTSVFAIALNLVLFFVKLYVGISSASLSIYCDAVNNLGDTVSGVIALTGFILTIKLNEKKSERVQALASFVIGLILAVTGVYFAYSGLERLMYPVTVSYQRKYAVLIAVTVFVKLFMGIVYFLINRKAPSVVFKTLIIDSFLDTAITLCALLGLTLCVKVNFALDGIISIVIGTAVAVQAVKTIIEQGKLLING